MCGIAGMISLCPIKHSTIDNMLIRIEHRGPDDTGVFGFGFGGEKISCSRAEEIPFDSKIVMGFNRLSIQDLSYNGHQPMVSDDGNIILTFNGEIYNTKELKKQLQLENTNIKYNGTCDTEVVLKCYQQWGISFLKKVNGMFAIVILDMTKNRMFMARDKWGIIPLHFLFDQNYIAWSSEIKSFLDIPEFKREIDIESMSYAYMYYNPTKPLFRKVKDVVPGTYCEIIINEHLVPPFFKKYFSINEYMKIEAYKDEEEVIERYEDVLKKCVERQLIGDVPLGLQLSGGVDSTSIAYWAVQCCSKDKRLKTISLIHTDDYINTEKDRIDHVLNSLFCEPVYSYANNNLFLNNFEKTIYSYERLLGVQSGIAIYNFSKDISKDVTVLLSGEGADEICGGYGLATNGYSSDFEFTDEFLLGFDRQLIYYENGKNMIYDFEINGIYEDRKSFLDDLDGIVHQKIQALWMKEELVSLLERQNKITMAHSIENRVPFLDDEMVKFIFSLPLEYIERKVDDTHWQTKYIIKKKCADYFGEGFAFQNKKGMRFRISDQINTIEFKEYLNTLIIPKMRDRGIVNMKEFEKRYRRMVNGQDVMSVWKAICIETWMQLFVDGRRLVEE